MGARSSTQAARLVRAFAGAMLWFSRRRLAGVLSVHPAGSNADGCLLDVGRPTDFLLGRAISGVNKFPFPFLDRMNNWAMISASAVGIMCLHINQDTCP